MSISVTIGNNGPLTLNTLTDLKDEYAKVKGGSVLKLGHEFDAFLQQPISALPAGLNSIGVGYDSGNQSWTPGSLSFTLSGAVTSKLSILTSGKLLPYTDGFPTTVTLGEPPVTNNGCSARVDIQAPDAYVCLELSFTLSGGISASYTQGIYGVSADGTAASTITVGFYKRCSTGTLLQDAIASAFEGFVLPLHPDTLTHLAVGDYLHYTCNASLSLGLGATVGVNKVLYSGQYKSNLPIVGSLLNINATLAPHAQAGAKLSFAYDYTGAFEVLLWRPDEATAQMHLYRSSVQDKTLGLNVGVTASADASLQTGINPADVEKALAKRVPVFADPAFQTSVFGPANDELGKYVTEMNTKMGSWIVRLNNEKAALDVTIANTQDRFLLTDYTIQLAQPWQPAWELMIDGQFLKAFSLPNTGITLSTGSGLENIFTTTTSLKLNLFGKVNDTWSTSTMNNSSLLYAGNNHFHLIANEGVSLLRDLNKQKREIDIFFAAEAELDVDGAPAKPDINLHVTLQSCGDQGFGGYIAKVVSQLTLNQENHQILQSIGDVNAKPGSTVLLHLIFSPGAYTMKLLSSTLDAKGKPDNEFPDQNNFNVFAKACSRISIGEDPKDFSYQGRELDYALWKSMNIAANDSAPPTNAKPTRRDIGDINAGTAYLSRQGFGSASPLIGNVLNVGANFMNLCDDLKTLSASTADTELATWELFVAQLHSIIKNDVSVDYIPPTALALATLCGAAPAAVSGPVSNLPTGSSVSIKMTY